MGTTSYYALPYPDPTSTVDVPRDIKALADKLELWKNGLVIPSGDIQAMMFRTLNAGIVRPLPFAIACDVVDCTAPAAGAGVSVATTFPAGRFTAIPIVMVTCESNGYSAPSRGAATTTGVTVRYFNPGPGVQSATRISWLAVQMTSTVGPGRAAPAAMESHDVTCHVDGCENGGIPIPLAVESDVERIYCGACSQPIDDVQPITRKGKRHG